ncbi:MAG: GNAT family N-acetyltransferase [Spirochaetaceae bacterium]|jgi:GNAT superfamily N-acetyltransferase|nr:GNAT family N-acetyltransferase [Spirochaetaceae bacterium]
MHFKLNPELINKILFAMENQNTIFVLDTKTSNIVPSNSVASQQERYIALPMWNSGDGYRIRERFAVQVADQDLTEELLSALNLGKGVFRAFKEVLRQHPKTEEEWVDYRNRELKRIICSWYNALKEEWGLEYIGEEPEETIDLVEEDFTFQSYEDGIVAQTTRGDYAGRIGVMWRGTTQYIHKFEVNPEYRGLGLGEALLTHFLNTSDVETIFIDLPASAEDFAKTLLRKSFIPYTIRYKLDRKKHP